MKKAILFTLLIAGVDTINARWSNTTNPFYDSLDIPVARNGSNQQIPLIWNGH